MDLIDMAHSKEENSVENPIEYVPPAYPYGLCLCLTKPELEKLGLGDDCEIGDFLHLVGMAEVTSISKSANATGENSCRVELQITHLGVGDLEEDRDDEESEYVPRRIRADNFYNS